MFRARPNQSPKKHAAVSRRRHGRRGTVLLFALGVLAIISVAALSYVTFVRVERNSSEAVAKTVGYDRQVKLVVDEIGAAIAADLWGNKIVTPDVPVDVEPNKPSEKPLWPSMFEDGEYRDYPFTIFSTFNRDIGTDKTRNPGTSWNLRVGARDRRVEVAPPDDAWLAPIDPIWDTIGGAQSHWRQITNLRSMYRYDDNGTPNDYTDDLWIRGDGRFVDLGQMITDPLDIGGTRRANPGTDLLDPTLGAIVPRDAAGTFANAPFRPMNFMSDNDPVLSPADERFWADTDGDLRADARWQIIDALGNAEGLLWVAATRIVDLSGMVNFNSALDGGFPSLNVDDYADGRTPADVDLYRFLLNDLDAEGLIPSQRIWDWSGSPYPRPAVNRLSGVSMPDGGTFSDHLIERLRFLDITRPSVLSDPDTSTVGNFVLDPSWSWKEAGGLGGRLNADHHLAYWTHIGSAPGRGPTLDTPSGPVRPGYTNEVMIDLCAFAGSNNRSILSEWEETIDGPDDLTFPGFLPRPEDAPGDAVGPLGARKRAGDARFFSSSPAQDATPATLELRNDIRRLLTSVNGASDVSPVPVLNFDAVDWNGDRPYYPQRFNRKIRLQSFTLSDVPDAYQAFVWALAPLATNQYLVGFNHDSLGNGIPSQNVRGIASPAAHYGGADANLFTTPVDSIDLSGGTASVEFGPSSGASFATLTSASLALNLSDATDVDHLPSVGRLLVSQSDSEVLRTRLLDGRVYFGHRFSHGDIPSASLPFISTGQSVKEVNAFEEAVETGDRPAIEQWKQRNDRAHGVTLVGAERNPYIGEITVIGLYQSDDRLLSVTDPGEQLGSILAVQMFNPWPVELSLEGYELVFIDPTNTDGDKVRELVNPDNLRFRFGSNSIVPGSEPGVMGTMTFHFITYDSGKESAPGALLNVIGRGEDDLAQPLPMGSIEELLQRFTQGPTSAFRLEPDADTQAYIDANPGFIIKLRNEGGGEKMTAVLQRGTSAALLDPNTGEARLAVVDILETNQTFFNYPDTIDLADGALGFTGNLNYFKAIGYDDVDTLGSATEAAFLNNSFGGRIAVVSTMNRPVRRGPGTAKWFSYAAIQPTASETWVRNMVPAEYYAHAWLVGANPSSGFPGVRPPEIDLITNYLSPGLPVGRRIPETGIEADFELDRISDKTADLSFGDRVPSVGGWQMFIPNRPLRYVSDLHRLSIFSHMCLNNEVNNLEAWTTVGSMLRWSFSADYNRNNSFASNAYLGVLDPSRFMPDGSGVYNDGGFPLDDSLAVPLAVRVFDCFEALEPADTLAQGRVNINTAPERVLQMLPAMAPPQSNGYLNVTNDRVDFLLKYRDAWAPGNDSLGDYVDYTTLNSALLVGIGNTMGIDSAKLRRHDFSHQPNAFGVNVQYPYTRGIATVGELTFMDLWGFDGVVSGGAPTGFLSPICNDGEDAGTPAGTFSAAAMRLIEGEVVETFPGLPDSIVDDPEERLALFRAVSNIVTTRSDVYGAWFVLRGYDPKQIESITIDSSETVNEVMNKTENNFRPVYESRWFVIYDRSNCKSPTDRPKVLLKAQLPSAKP